MVDGHLSPTLVVLQQPQFDDVVVSLDRGHGGHVGRVHGVVAGGGDRWYPEGMKRFVLLSLVTFTKELITCASR